MLKSEGPSMMAHFNHGPLKMLQGLNYFGLPKRFLIKIKRSFTEQFRVTDGVSKSLAQRPLCPVRMFLK